MPLVLVCIYFVEVVKVVAVSYYITDSSSFVFNTKRLAQWLNITRKHGFIIYRQHLYRAFSILKTFLNLSLTNHYHHKYVLDKVFSFSFCF